MSTGDKTRVSTATSLWNNVIEENSYDIEGRVSEYKVTYAGVTSQPMVTSYLYDTVNRLTEVRYPASYGIAGNPRKIVTPSYDESSRLKELKVDNQIQMSEIVYNPLSQVTQLKTGAATGNADIEQYTYDNQTGLLVNQRLSKANTGAELMNLSYEYNRGNSNGTLNGKTGQMTRMIDNRERNRDRAHEFDSLGRLIKAKGGLAAGATGVTANWTQDYSYDRYGNKTGTAATGVTVFGGPVQRDGLPSMSYNTATNRMNSTGWEYDLAGNMTRGQNADGVWQRYEYDSAGRLRRVLDDVGNWLQDNNYGSGRQRIFRNEPGGSGITWFVWGGDSVLAEYTSTSWGGTYTWAKSYVYAGSRLLMTSTNNGAGGEALEFQHPDQLGTRMVTDPAANTLYLQSTLPFGTQFDSETTGSSNRLFTSYDRSAGTGLDNAVNRTYSSGQGRFNQPDPIGMESVSLADPQSLNQFAYTRNSPTDFVDPSGLLLAAPNCRILGLEVIQDGGGIIATYACEGDTGGGGAGYGIGHVVPNNAAEQQNDCPEQDLNFSEGANGLTASELSEIAQTTLGEASTRFNAGEINLLTDIVFNRLSSNLFAAQNKGNPAFRGLVFKTFSNGATTTAGILREFQASFDRSKRKDRLRAGEGKIADAKRQNNGKISATSPICSQLIEAKSLASGVGDAFNFPGTQKSRGVNSNRGYPFNWSGQPGAVILDRIGGTEFGRVPTIK